MQVVLQHFSPSTLLGASLRQVWQQAITPAQSHARALSLEKATASPVVLVLVASLRPGEGAAHGCWTAWGWRRPCR